MKTRNFLYLLIILLTYFISSLAADDTCPAGMRKTYVDDTTMNNYGSARRYMAAVCFFQFPGSLFFARKVLIEPRFEVHLKATTDPIDIVEKTKEQRLYGFTIVISGYKNTISGLEARSYTGDADNIVFEDIGYNNFVNSLIIEFDFEKDTYDPDSSSFSVRFCDTSCHSKDNIAMYSARLNNQRYDPRKTNNWDFRLIYDTKKLYIYSGPNEILYSVNYDLEATLGTNIAFVGFTGFMESNRREISLIGSFICEDNYLISLMPGNFYINGELKETASYEAGAQLNYLFSFINNKGQTVPHTYGYNIWSYSFTLNLDCGSNPFSLTKQTNYTLILSTKACTKAGVHSIHISEKLKGNAPVRYYTVYAGPLSIITLIGHDGIIGTVPSKTNYNDVFYLNYGDSPNKDFIIKKSRIIILDFLMTDQYGNIVTVNSPSSLFTIKRLEGEVLSTVTSSMISYTIKKINDNYQMTITINKIGIYQIEKNSYMSKPIRFNVVPGEVSTSQSYCTLDDSILSNLNLQPNKNVIYNCFLKDDNGNEITPQIFTTNSIYDFSCQTQRTAPSSKTYASSVQSNPTYYSCIYKTSDTGVFQINGYLTKKGTTSKTKINSKINQFSVRGNASSLKLKNILNLYDNKWKNIDNSEITYTYNKNGLITALDLVDGETLVSSYGEYPPDFDISKIQAQLYSNHGNDYNHNLVSEFVTIDGAQYIGIYLPKKNTGEINELVRKSSFDYLIKVTYVSGNDEKIVTLKYIINIGSYTTCFHDMDKEKTNLEQSWQLEFITGGNEMKIARIELRTTDYYLYNYDIGVEKIQYTLQPSGNYSPNAIKFRVVPLSIEGTYDIYAKAEQDFTGNMITKVDGHQLRSQWVSANPPLACYLVFKNPEYFEFKETKFKDHFYEYTGTFEDGNLRFLFTIQDKNGNEIIKEDYFSAFADIYSEQYGNDITRFTIKYNELEHAYDFKDNLPFESRKYSWVFFMRESSCNNKYYIRYDGMRRGNAEVDLQKSYFNLLNTQININEYAYVDVIYKDTNDQFLGLQEGVLEEKKKDTVVKALSKNGNVADLYLEFDSITSNYAIRYKKKFDISGNFTIKVIYGEKNEEIQPKTSDTLIVIDNLYSLKNSKLQMILASIIDMNPDVRVTIDNTIQTPLYKLYFYSATGVKTTISEKDTFTCIMTGTNVEMILNVEKKLDYITFTYRNDYPKQFYELSQGNYILTVSDTHESINYPLFLKGDGTNDTSNLPDYDITKTEVYPTHIDGIAGKTYSFNVEFKASDGLRWNHLVDVNSFTFTNSYGLSSEKLTFKVEQGFKKGQAIITVNQKQVTTENDNILTIYYEKNKIPKTVSLSIKCGDFNKLVYVSGPTNGNVIIPPILTFKPVDAYGNLYTGLFNTLITNEYLNSLTVGKSDDKVPLTTNNYLKDGQYLKVQYLSTISTDVEVSSLYFEKTYKYRIKSGPIDPDTSYAELKSQGNNEVGSKHNITIYPKDKYKNDIDDLDEVDLADFYTYYKKSGETNINNVTNCELRKKSEIDNNAETSIYDSIECSTTITKIGTMGFHVNYKVTDEIECINCDIFIISNNVKFMNTKTYYKNKNIYLKVDELNEVQAKIEPTFELTFFDEYLNQIGSSIVQDLKIQPVLEGTDIKLCISNSGEKKIINLCQAVNGDDNINKWQYLTNGENYKLILIDENNKPNNIAYPIKITGGATEGSSEDEDLTKTNFSPNIIEVQAGEEGKTIMEIRTAKEIRKNYWYPNPSEKIKIEFDTDKDTCSYKIELGDLPGRYAITIICTKTNDNNAFSVTIGSTKLNKKVNVKVTSGPAYYLEIEDTNKFIISSDKFTFKENPTNDDTISFSFKLKDKYNNYIKNSIIGKNEIAISSDVYGTNEKYYSLDFNIDKIDYLFTDKIAEVINKHIWYIICIESNRKYSFIYTKVAGKPDLEKSFWTIDKTDYILYENSTVLVTLLDRLGVNIGTIKGKLSTEQQNVKVVTSYAEREKSYDFISITNENNLKYIYNYILIGDYQVSVTYNGNQIKQKKSITVSYQVIDLKSNKLYYDIGDNIENLMLTNSKTNIKNKEEYPFYKFYLYTAEGNKITTYDKEIYVTCEMKYGDQVWELEVTKEDEYIKFEYKDGFRTVFEKLPLGNYNLEITLDKETIVYPLYLLGDKDVSPYPDYDLTKTFIKPTYVNGIAGKQYVVDIEFRAKDNLRWNYDVDLSLFTITNSYNLDTNNLIIVKKLGEKSGQIQLLITQKVASSDGVDNLLSFSYNSKEITQKVTLHIKCADLKFLEYDSGAKDGTVINPSVVKFIPRDEYGNLYTDLFDQVKYPKKELEKLTNGLSVEGYDVKANSYVSDEKYLNVQYKCNNVTTIKVTCNNNLNPNTYIYKLWSGPISAERSYAKVEKTEDVKAGEITNITIYPKDMYGNDVTNVTSQDLDKFNVDYDVNKNYKVDISDSCIMAKINSLNQFNCSTSVTKSGNVLFTIDFDDKPVTCKNCEFVINPDKIDFSKTKVYNKNENKEMSKTELNTLPVTTTPNFELHFFDRFLNSILNKTEVEELVIKTTFIVTDVELCVTNNEVTKLSTICKTNGIDENEEKWKYLPNGEGYKLNVIDKNDDKLTFPVKLIGGYNEGSPGPVNPSKTYLNPTEITIVAGEERAVSLELRTIDNIRKNYWYKEPNNHIWINFPDKVEEKCSYSLKQAEKPGQYYILFNCTEKKDAFNTYVSIENETVTQPIIITVIPGEPAKSLLFKMNGEEIITSELGSVSVEDKFQMINKLYDKYNNLITNFDFPLSTLGISINPFDTQKSLPCNVELITQKIGEIIITLRSTYAGRHNVYGTYFPLLNYNITFTPGKPHAGNSLLKVSKTEALAGEEVKIYIIPYDQYNNYIDANEFKDTSPYQVKYSSEGSEIKVITEKYNIENLDSLNVLSYPGIFYIKGITNVYGFIDTEQIQCVSCRINIKSKDISFLNSFVLRYESTKNDFEILKNGTIEQNMKEEPIYRLYPRDQYDNSIDYIPPEKLENYTAYLKSQSQNISNYYLKLNNKDFNNQEYAEFIINDIEGSKNNYSDLVKGFYDLVFTDTEKELVYNITLVGNDNGGSNEEEDIQKTHIVEQNLKYVAGSSGYMIIEIRTKGEIRRNAWGYKFRIESCDESDKSFSYFQDNAGLKGVFYITVTSKKANTYPSISKCPLKIYVNDVLVEKLKPEMEVSPDEIVRTEILTKYYKPESTTILLDGVADTNYIFEVASYDKYENFAETDQNIVEIKISLKGGDEVTKTTSETNTVTGYRKYNVPCTKAGTYIVNTVKSGPNGLYLPNESLFIILAGAIDLSKTIIKEKSTPIEAGTYPAISIDAYDQYGNPLDYSDYINEFEAIFIDSKSTDHSSKGSFDVDIKKVYYTSETPVTIVGKVKVEVTYNKTDTLDTSKIIIEVIPGEPDTKNSILSRETSKGVFTQYKNGDSFNVNVDELLILNITLYDKYNNYISNIPGNVSIENPTMSGNYMEEIKFTVTQNTGYFGLDFNENSDYIYIYRHLVGGTYDLNYQVKTSLEQTDFKYNIIITSEDDKHGNGPYDIEKCVLTPKNVSFTAGNYEQFILELKTKQNLLYNDDIDINNDIIIENTTIDDSFSYVVRKNGSVNGIYTIRIYSEKKGEYILNVLLKDPSSTNNTKKNIGPVMYIVSPDKVPFSLYTKIMKKPEPEIESENNFEIIFILADKFNNVFEERNDIVDNNYLTLFNNKEPLQFISLSLLAGGQKYQLTIYPKYPPRTMSMNVLYNDGENTAYCFENDINTTISTKIDYYLTQIVSSNKDKIRAGELLDMWLYTFDKRGECYDDQDYSIYYDITTIGPLDSINQFTKTYSVKRTNNITRSECNNEYQIITTENDKYRFAGKYIIKVIGGGNLIAQFNQECFPLGYSLFLLEYEFDPNTISALDIVSFIISGTDIYGNKVEEALLDDINITFTKNGEDIEFESNKKEMVIGYLQYDVSIHIIGSYQLHIFYKGEEIPTVNNGEELPIFTILPGPCRAEDNSTFDLSPLEGIETFDKAHFTFQCYDIYNNKITKGGEEFSVTAQYIYNGNTIYFSASVLDNEDGTYNVEFIPEYQATYLFNLLVGKERYGEEIKWVLQNLVCSGDKPVLCPNIKKCVKTVIECIPSYEKCQNDITKPFYCKINGEYTCTKSQTDCDCPSGYIKCDLMKYCVPEDRPDMCPKLPTPDVKCKLTNSAMFEDGICRFDYQHLPNQRVCPIDYVLCADLSCRKSYDECIVTSIKPNKVYRCIGQELKQTANLCPSTFYCEDENEVVCPDGTCVSNEIYCGSLPKCKDTNPYLCQNLECKPNYESCNSYQVCGDYQNLCTDNFCRESCA